MNARRPYWDGLRLLIAVFPVLLAVACQGQPGSQATAPPAPTTAPAPSAISAGEFSTAIRRVAQQVKPAVV